MAFTDLGQLVASGSSGNNQASLAATTSANAAAGELVVVCVTVDNQATGGGDDASTSGVTIALSGGGSSFSLTKGRQNATNLAAQAGASVSLWWGVVPIAYPSGSTITANFTTNSTSDATALSARHFSFDALVASVAVEATNATTATTTNPGSLDAGTALLACLRIRATGCEYDSTQTITTTSGWTTWTEGASAATGTITEQVIEVEHRISTGLGDASAPTLGSACDSASVYVAFKQVNNPIRQRVLDVPKGPQQGSINRRTHTYSTSPGDLAGPVVYVPPWGEWFNPWGPKPLVQDHRFYNPLLQQAAAAESISVTEASLTFTGSDVTILEGDIANLPSGMVGGYVPWAAPRGRQSFDYRPLTLYQAVVELVDVVAGALAPSGSSIAEAETLSITSTNFSLSGSEVVAADAIAITSGSLALVGETIGVLDRDLVSITEASLTLSPQSIGTAGVEVVDSGSLALLGSDIGTSGVENAPGYAEWFNPWGPQRGRQFWIWPTSPYAFPAVTVTVDSASLVLTGNEIALVDSPSDVMPAQGMVSGFNPWGRKYPTGLRTWTNLGLPSVNYVFRKPLFTRLWRRDSRVAIQSLPWVRNYPFIPTSDVIPIVSANLVPIASTIGIIDTQAITSTALTLSGSSIGESDSIGITSGSITLTQHDIGIVDITLDLTPVTAGALALSPQSIGVVDSEVVGSQSLALVGQSITFADANLVAVDSTALALSPQSILDIETITLVHTDLSLLGGDVGEVERISITSASLAFVGSAIGAVDGVVDSVAIDSVALALLGGDVIESDIIGLLRGSLLLTPQSIIIAESSQDVESAALILLPQDVVCREVAGSHEAGPGRWYSQIGSWRPKDRAGPRYKIYPS